MIPAKLLYYFLYFGIMAFFGWVIEVIYRSKKEKRFVNAGFLSGPFLPIYGFSAVIITAVSVEARNLPLALGWTITLLSPTVLEYFGGWMMERFFGRKLWDYHHERFNLHGRICLRFSVYWAFCAAILVVVIQPRVYTRITILGPYLSHFIAGGFFAYLVLDINHSVRSLSNFKVFEKNVIALLEKGKQYCSAFDIAENDENKLPVELRHILKPLNSFPSIRKSFGSKLHVFPDALRMYLEKRIGSRK
jgi:uncharacterized membrane protein